MELTWVECGTHQQYCESSHLQQHTVTVVVQDHSQAHHGVDEV